MPYLLSDKISRKDFLIKSIQIGGAFASMGSFYNLTYGGKHNVPNHIALLADTHIRAYQNEQYRGFFPAKNFEVVIGQVSKVHPEMMIINGDIARLEGDLGDYAAVQQYLEALDKDIPVFMTLGNHDRRDNFYNLFGEKWKGKQEVQNKHVVIMDLPDVRFILLDSLMYVNKTPGLLGETQRAWLKRYLESSDKKPAFLFVHHTLNDGDSDLLDADRLFNIILPHKKVKAIFYGHSHIYNISERHKIKLINIPAVGYNFIDSQPVGWIEAKISPDSGLFTLHAIGGNVAKDGEVTEVRWR